MAGELGRTNADLENDLLENGAAYDFFQAVRMISLLNRHSTNNNVDANDYKVIIRPELSFNYPDADLSAINKLESDEGFSITTTFMGLYGVSSPLPAYFTEELLDDEWEEDTAPKGFLDVIHQHLYPILYQAWVKYKFSHNAIEHGNEKYWDILYSLMGIGADEMKGALQQPEILLRYTGLLSQKRKSAVGLQTILKDYLSPFNVELEQCVQRMVTIPLSQRLKLGLNQSDLGMNAVLGLQVPDRTGKLTVRIGPLKKEQYHDLMTDKSKMEFVRFIVNFYKQQPLEYEIALTLAPGTIEGVSLGTERWSSLGSDTWLYLNGNSEEVDMFL